MVSKRELKLISKFVDEMGADFMLELRDQPELSTLDRAKARLSLEEWVTDWHLELLTTTQRCTCQPAPHDPVMPLWSPHQVARAGRVAVIGPSPTHDAVRRGGLGYSRAEKMLAQHLRHAGIEPGMVTWLCACWCWPQAGDATPRKRDTGTRSPTAAEVNYWQPWTMKALEAADVEWVLLHGMHAVKLWRGDLPLAKVAGGLYLWANRWKVVPLHHASSVMRQDGYPETEWKQQVAAFADRVLEGHGLESLGESCVVCGHGITAWDQDGVPYCREHLGKGIKGKQAADRRAAKNRKTDQGVLL